MLPASSRAGMTMERSIMRRCREPVPSVHDSWAEPRYLILTRPARQRRSPALAELRVHAALLPRDQVPRRQADLQKDELLPALRAADESLGRVRVHADGLDRH